MVQFSKMNNDHLLRNKITLVLAEAMSGIHADATLVEKCAAEILDAYSTSARHYHNLAHLARLTSELEEVKPHIQRWPAILFAVLYHDIVYSALSSDNEEKSALLAQKRLTSLHVSPVTINSCIDHILATKNHEQSKDADTSFFVDADLSILGANATVYELYAAQIRKEFSFYPNLIYNNGRKKVLQRFLQMPVIFKTQHFQDKYESQARANIAQELEMLSK